MDMPLVAALLTFLGVILASTAVFSVLNSRQAVQTWRRRADGSSTVEANEPEGALEEAKAQLYGLLEWFAKLNQPSNLEEAKATRRQLINAGYRSRKAPIFYVGAKLFLATVFVFLLTLIPAKVMGFPTVMNLIFFYLLAATCGYYAPALWLKMAISSRQDALNRAMPDALDLMVVCVEAG